MNEWTVIEALVVIVGLFFTVGKPLLQNTRAMTELTCSIKTLSEEQEVIRHELESLKSDNTNAHKRMWDKNDEQDKLLMEHEIKISLLENES